MPATTKRPWRSKILWFNLVSGIVATAQALSHTTYIPIEYLAAVIALGNVVLRVWFTDTKLTLR